MGWNRKLDGFQRFYFPLLLVIGMLRTFEIKRIHSIQFILRQTYAGWVMNQVARTMFLI